jgi:ribonucleoside-triphosphate reductase (thioredoxin)
VTNWGPNGQVVFERTYSRPKPDGTRETWPETVDRVVKGNLSLAYGDEHNWTDDVYAEYVELVEAIEQFEIIPAGRHLWASGVKGRQYLMNCWVSGWGEKLSDHFAFTFARLMEGGGVGANYSSHYIEDFGAPRRELDVHIVCDPSHPDYADMLDADVLSQEYTADWDGAFQVEDSREGWAEALVDLIDTYMTDDEVIHTSRVYDVTNVRAKGARLKTFGGTASGPQPFATMMLTVGDVLNGAVYCAPELTPSQLVNALYSGFVPVERRRNLTPLEVMEIDHAIAECVVSGGVRRSARMAIVRWDDPYIMEFIDCKADTGLHWTTNISVEIDDTFIAALEGQRSLRSATVEHARNVHAAVVKGMLSNGEPGYWNSSLSNKGEVEPVYATNPCGEITLGVGPNGSGEACNLGHVNLDAFAPRGSHESWNLGGLFRAHELVARFLIRATFADINDEGSRDIQDRMRRIGVGHLGVQDFLVKSGYKYSDIAAHTSKPGHYEFRNLLTQCYNTTRLAARDYAFQLRIPEPVKVTTVAPTGSISKLPGVGGEGIHPIYSRFFEQRIRFNKNDPEQLRTIEEARDQGFAVEVDQYDASGNTLIVVYPSKNRLVSQVEDRGYPGHIVEQADEISLNDMLAFQAMYQTYYADNAVSFTVNVPEGMDPHVTATTIQKWLPVLKGTTVMVDGTRPQAPFTRITEAEYDHRSLMRVESDGIDMDCASGACPIR